MKLYVPPYMVPPELFTTDLINDIVLLTIPYVSDATIPGIFSDIT
jgi:hypothetical protein